MVGPFPFGFLSMTPRVTDQLFYAHTGPLVRICTLPEFLPSPPAFRELRLVRANRGVHICRMFILCSVLTHGLMTAKSYHGSLLSSVISRYQQLLHIRSSPACRQAQKGARCSIGPRTRRKELIAFLVARPLRRTTSQEYIRAHPYVANKLVPCQITLMFPVLGSSSADVHMTRRHQTYLFMFATMVASRFPCI
ncbi:hypothetical protein K437DRAFT_163857 [Tilletiaria anomala UBC 951]|uniref:Uncharacterized protein n=1 Tax=Tilletiaria anomala (strain ATCC 24038 / CBS 436.72 / UBC 951) TaxID=1037660 RepID=A0A066WJM7_TILAU|nr:uncharacterized protein K437DRAFT_163857 [Tilletiaria anomala UBC 951]KDN52763.1 hypothetical protein K437DRAFT_163857 [Tilletiaria anomala UBC 951]